MSEPDNPDDGSTTTEMTERIVREVRPFLQPDKVQEATQHIGQMVVSELYQEFHQGPLPTPRLLNGYEEVLPGSAERIVQMAEREQEHRHGQEGRIVGGEIGLKFIGQGFAFASLILMIGLLAYMVYAGAAGQAATLGVVMVTGVIGLFLAPRFFHRPEQPAPEQRQNQRQKPRKRR